MRIRINSEEIFVYTITDEYYIKSSEMHKTSTNRLSYQRSRYLLDKKRSNYPTGEYHHNISHAETVSSVAFSTNPHLGVDIEPFDRKLGKNLLNKLRKKSKDLEISEIELWCIMESTYKSKKLSSGENFLKYDFYAQDNLFFHESPQGKIASHVRKLKDLILSVSVLV